MIDTHRMRVILQEVIYKTAALKGEGSVLTLAGAASLYVTVNMSLVLQCH